MARNDALRRGAAYRRDGHVWVVRYLRDGIIHMQHGTTGARRKLTLEQWQHECAEGTLVPVDEAEAEAASSQKDGLRYGAYLRRFGFTWRILLLKDGVIHLENVDTPGETDKLTVDEWMRGCLDGSIHPAAEPGKELKPKTAELLKVAFGDMPESMKASGILKMQYINAFRDPAAFYERKRPDVPVEQRVLTRSRSAPKLRPFLAHVAEAIGAAEPPGASTFARWFKDWSEARAAGYEDVRVLVNNYHRRGPQHRFMGAMLEEWLNDVIDKEWLLGTKPKKKKVYDELKDRVKSWNKAHPLRPIAMISERHVNRYIKEEVDKYVETARRDGRRKADETYGMVGIAPEPENILDVVEVDHSRRNVEVIDDISGVRLGRPWVTVAFDRYSRMPLACHIHFDGQCLSSVMQALRQTMLPKDFLKEMFPDLSLDYGCYGRPVCFFFDRGTDFDNEDIRDIGLQLDIRMDLEPVGCPETKGKIERFFRTMQEEVDHPLPGSCPSLLKEGERSELRGEATILFSDFVRRTWLWLYGVYARSWHRGIKDVPIKKWQESAARRLPRPPCSRKELDILLTRIEPCTITKMGVRWNHLRWSGDILKTIWTRPGFAGKVKVRIDEQDVSRAWVIDPATRTPVELEPMAPDYMAGLSLFQHRLALCAADEQFEGARDDETLITAKKMLDDQARELLHPDARDAGKALGTVGRYLAVGSRALDVAQADQAPPTSQPEMPEQHPAPDPQPETDVSEADEQEWTIKRIRKE